MTCAVVGHVALFCESLRAVYRETVCEREVVIVMWLGPCQVEWCSDPLILNVNMNRMTCI